MELPQTKSEFKELVKDGIVIFDFIKKTDGTERKMIGTFDLKKLPLYDLPSGDFDHEVPDYIVPIYDLEMGDWRSFDINNLISINQILKVSAIEQKKLEYLTELYSYEGKRSKDYKTKRRVRFIKLMLKLLGL